MPDCSDCRFARFEYWYDDIRSAEHGCFRKKNRPSYSSEERSGILRNGCGSEGKFFERSGFWNRFNNLFREFIWVPVNHRSRKIYFDLRDEMKALP